MQRRTFLLASTTALLAVPTWGQSDSGIVVIGHASLPRIDAALVQRLYTGRAIEVAGQLVTVLNLPAGNAVRQRFLNAYLATDEERYRAYWTVRRHVGKGAPPRELDSVADVIDFTARTPGAVGYVDAASVRPGMNVICRP
jgi:hypothetical protein